jgi:hypothetical protein
MNYIVDIEGFEGQKIEVQPAGLFGTARLFVNDVEARKGAKRGEMILTRNDGKEVVAAWRNNFLDVPKLLVENKVINVAKPLAWYEWVWNCLPVVLLFGGGALGGLFGALAIVFNLNVFRSQQNTWLKYLVTGLISFSAMVAYLIAGIAFSLLINR